MTEEATVPEQRTVSADEQALLRRLRAGEDRAFSELFEQHSGAVRRLARGIASDASEAEDITAETFFRVLQALRRGSGPRDHIRAYLLTVARRVSWEWHGSRRDVPVTDDELTVRVGAGVDAHARTAEHTLIATAFTSLPERWRTVLWQTEVEGEQPAVVAPHFGLSANATAALARRARQGLRAAYLQAHLAMNRTSDVSCRGVIEKLGGYTAGSVTGSEAARIRTHLLGCASCRAMHAELRDVCSSLRSHAGVLAMLVPSTAAVAASGHGALATLKGLVLSKLKVGIALVSTAAAGVVGVTVGPALINPDHAQTVGLPQSGIELRIAPTEPSLLSPPPQQPVTPDEATLRLPGAPVIVQREAQAPPPAGAVATAPAGPKQAPAAPKQVPAAPPQSQQGRSDPPATSSPSSSSGTARDDLDSTSSTPPSSTKPGKARNGNKNNNSRAGTAPNNNLRADPPPADADVTATQAAKPSGEHSTFFWWLFGPGARNASG
ncbi:sigma-70 family RNA polymerase sigma factor [Amycolatopsis alkalitolerans]|uniref:Sigma-70 family RNA polymerase sigma factor n=1 Tax=Amycolatopsis alkalitolerans TaxID=2547244 RepID=A0A5C4M6V1_9PSEU|nr:sigma-70 family RNA polymerase sigma factor [Amycolatopsis alkalitolerans]TNC27364.1 sigma-70 family RNA polymerase sigma factor [Amycolatopsis alkalitolerans]